jgi:hypothetical protein
VVLEKDAEYHLTYRVRNEELLQDDKEERNILRTINRRKTERIGHVLRSNFFLKRAIERNIGGKLKVTGRRRKICKQLLEDLKEKGSYWKLK